MSSILYSISKEINKVFPAKSAHAHCDIPCGIYDPHEALVAAHTVIRMIELTEQLKTKENEMSKEDYIHAIARYTATKEQYAERCKHEIRVIWGDYFKPENVQQFPEIHELVWKVMKLGSKSKQEMHMADAEGLLETVNQIAEIFWKTKNIETVRIKSFYPTGRDMVYPKT